MIVLVSSASLMAQGTPPMDPEQMQQQKQLSQGQGPPQISPQSGPMQDMKKLVKQQINRSIMGRPYPAIDSWKPLTPREKFQVFLAHTYSPRTFASAGVDSIAYKIKGDNGEYERGVMGFGQHYGIELATSETDVFFERFLVPTLLKQDPRYFRNPQLPFFKRALYSVSRVLITRSDKGGETFNASKVLGGAAAQALSDLYVPGQRQGLGPIRDRVTFDLLRDAGFNLVHEFWPDLRRKVFHH